MNVSRLIVRFRWPLIVLTTTLAVIFACCIPKINIVMEMSYFLADDSPIKRGISLVQKEFPGIDLEARSVNVMFEGEADTDSTLAVLKTLTGGLVPSSILHSQGYTLFRFLPTRDTDEFACKQAILDHFGDDVTVELDIEKNMPANIVPMVAWGTALVFLILFIMCSSFMEVLLFLIATLLAVTINMGSNILFPSISFVTSSIAGVLQMILSMDYSIILMNRYRQEKQKYTDTSEAMAHAVKGAAPSVLSSAMTTIVSLLMLMFMSLKIGADLGSVLAKGVLCSLVCNFTVLPALAIKFDKAITATSKKRPALPAKAMSGFEMRFRVPLAVLFVVIFVASFQLQKRTEVSFSAIWPTPISDIFPPENPVIILYDNADETNVPGILDTLERDPSVLSCLSYPGLMLRGYTAGEMAERFGSLSPLVTEELLRIVYYAHAHPVRDEKLSIEEIQNIADELAAQGMIPDGMDSKSLAAKLMPPAPAAAPSVRPGAASSVVPPAQQAVVPDSSLVAQVKPVADSSAAVGGTPGQAGGDAPVMPGGDRASQGDASVMPGSDRASQDESPAITYELAITQMDSKAMAEMIGVERSLIKTVYRMAGRNRKPATMSPYELSTFLVQKVLTDKRYSSYVSGEQAAELREIHRQLDSAFLAGPTPIVSDQLLADGSLSEEASTDSLLLATAGFTQGGTVVETPPVEPAPEPDPVVEEDEEPEPEPTPLERLAEMAFSGNRYSSRKVCSALNAAGIRVSRSDMDLLYLHAGSRNNYDNALRMSVGELLDYLDGTLLKDPAMARFIDPDAAQMLSEVRESLEQGAGSLHSDKHSLALINTCYDFETPETFAFVERVREMTDRSLAHESCLIGESLMYKEFKDGFPDELKLLTLLTVVAIFVIVLLTFRSLVIPVFLIITVMSGVYIDVFVTGLGGNTMFFVAYLIMQSILMGATIDYSILFTSFYRDSRRRMGIKDSLKEAYDHSGHSIMTSGLILTVAPYVMSLTISDQIVRMILKPLSIGALAAILIILLILPGLIAMCDRLVAPKDALRQ